MSAALWPGPVPQQQRAPQPAHMGDVAALHLCSLTSIALLAARKCRTHTGGLLSAERATAGRYRARTWGALRTPGADSSAANASASRPMSARAISSSTRTTCTPAAG